MVEIISKNYNYIKLINNYKKKYKKFKFPPKLGEDREYEDSVEESSLPQPRHDGCSHSLLSVVRTLS